MQVQMWDYFMSLDLTGCLGLEKKKAFGRRPNCGEMML